MLPFLTLKSCITKRPSDLILKFKSNNFLKKKKKSVKICQKNVFMGFYLFCPRGFGDLYRRVGDSVCILEGESWRELAQML